MDNSVYFTKMKSEIADAIATPDVLSTAPTLNLWASPTNLL